MKVNNFYGSENELTKLLVRSMAEQENKSHRDEFDDFLVKIERVGSIIKDLSSLDSETSKNGMKKADEYLSSLSESQDSKKDEDCNTVIFNKTSLNKKALEEKTESPDFSNMSAREFMAAAEKDANERYKNRLK